MLPVDVPRRLYLFSPLPPQRNGLADYLVEYLPFLAADFELYLVAESGLRDAARLALGKLEGVQVIDESEFLARQPEPGAQTLYNLGNNADCTYELDYLHRFPGAVIVHDISLFFLHQLAAQRARANSLLGSWLFEDGYQVPEDFLNRDGSLGRTPGELYQECLMLKRIAQSARGLMVHTRYAEQRLRGATEGVSVGPSGEVAFTRIPHFVLEVRPQAPESVAALLARFGVESEDFLLLVPGFLTGNKMLYEVMAACHQVQADCPGLKLLFAGEERADEYPVSERVAQLWPETANRPVVTGYLEAEELDALLQRADLSFVLRYPTYGESSGILPRAAMGGGRVLSVNIGAYPEFESPQVSHVPVGSAALPALAQGIRDAYQAWLADPPSEREERQLSEAARLQALAPQALYPALHQWLEQSWGAPA
ncbi:hypothetical protein [Ideonella sp.]|uniref:hypothetical protein n=1 Tax=Ideonella sp. TaxID=1929293 RepID=UPI003BB49C97